MAKIVVFSCDPGTKNFACSLTEYTYNKNKITKVKILGTCMLEETLQDLTNNVSGTLSLFRKRIRKMVKGKNVGAVCFERFQSRGLKGKTIEAIGFMLGQLAYVFKKKDPVFILASTWKNRINRFEGIKLNDVYKSYMLTRVASPKKDHELDAVLIGMYRIHKMLGFADFSYFDDNDFDDFMQNFLKAPTIEY